VAVPAAEFQCDLAEFPLSPGMGRFCGLDLRNGLDPFLVHGDDPGSGDHPRPCPDDFRRAHVQGQDGVQKAFEKFYFGFRKYFYGILAMGWRGSNRHWSNYEMAYLLLAGLSTPLVLSVHTVVSFDFAVANLPGWHTTIFPPYFVAGAIFSGFGMVLTLMLPLRAILRSAGPDHAVPH
jgi:hypothetical protein